MSSAAEQLASDMADLDRAKESLRVWLRESEGRVRPDLAGRGDLAERKCALERMRNLGQEIDGKRAAVDAMLAAAKALDEPCAREEAEEVVRSFNKLQQANRQLAERLQEGVSGQEEYRAASQKLVEWLNGAQLRLQRLSDLTGSQTDLMERRHKLEEFQRELAKEGQALLDEAVLYGDHVMKAGVPGAASVEAEVAGLQSDFVQLAGNASGVLARNEDCLQRCKAFDECHKELEGWMREVDKRLRQTLDPAADLDGKHGQARDYQVRKNGRDRHLKACMQANRCGTEMDASYCCVCVYKRIHVHSRCL